MRKIIHIDMDCFYAAIEMRDFPELSNKPIAVGGSSERRGVLTTCNYPARKFGIRSAMSTAEAKRRCPDLIIQPVRMSIYKEESACIKNILQQYTSLIEPLSLDEAYLDVTDSQDCQGSATWIAEKIRQDIWLQRELTASAGIAPNKSLAKIASDWHKPNGQMVITPDMVDAFLAPLPVRKLFGVGPVLEKRLASMNVNTCLDLRSYLLEDLTQQFGQMGRRLYELCRGIDERPVNPCRERKSISVEETFPSDLTGIDDCMAVLPMLISRLEKRCQSIKMLSDMSGVFIKIKFNDFSQTTVECQSQSICYQTICNIMTEGWERKKRPVRLLGIGLRLKQHQLAESQPQLQFDF